MDIASSNKSQYNYSQNCAIKKHFTMRTILFRSFRQKLPSLQKANILGIQGSSAFSFFVLR